jgi:hypothetical protein
MEAQATLVIIEALPPEHTDFIGLFCGSRIAESSSPSRAGLEILQTEALKYRSEE